jgi:hypothetical protein
LNPLEAALLCGMSVSDEIDDEVEEASFSEEEIDDEFGELSPAERSETIANFLSEYGDTMRDNNKRIFSRVLDMIAATEGDDKLHLDMLATHLEIEDPKYVEFKSWDMPEITSFSDYRARSDLGDDAGICEPFSEDYVGRYLSSLEIAVRKNASRDLLGNTAESLKLPAEFYEFLKHTGGAHYPNLDKRMFVCDLPTEHYNEEKHALPLDKLCEHAPCQYDFEVAAGWVAGDYDMSSRIYYLLCRDYDEPDEPWRWKVFYINYAFADGDHFDSLRDFLSWYCKAYDWVNWKAVQCGIDSLHHKCIDALRKEALEKEQMQD